MSKKYTTHQAAQQLKISTKTVCRYITSGLFPSAQKLNNKWLIDAIDIENFKVNVVVTKNRTTCPPIEPKELLIRRAFTLLSKGDLPNRALVLQMIAMLED